MAASVASCLILKLTPPYSLLRSSQENLNLKTNLEMMTYDLVEFDELSLETQMLREGQFRAERRLKDNEEEIKALRRNKMDLVKDMDRLKKVQAEKIREVRGGGARSEGNSLRSPPNVALYDRLTPLLVASLLVDSARHP